MATKKSNNANGNVATGKKFNYTELLAKAMGEKVIPVSEKVKDMDELFAKAMEKAKPAPGELAGRSVSENYKPSKTSQQLMEEINESILNSESEDDVEDVEIIEVAPVVEKKKIIPQTSAQAQKLLSKAKEKEAPKSFSEMTDEEKAARRKEISAKALAAKRAKKVQAEEEVQPEPKAPITRTRTNVSKPDVVADLINKGKEKENRAILNDLLLKLKGMTLAKVEESAGHLNNSEVVNLIAKIKEETPAKPEKSTRTKSAPENKIPLSKMTLAQLQEVKGTISDVQWMKYYKFACKREGVENSKPTTTEKKVTKSVAEEKKAPITRTRNVPVEKKSSSPDELAQIVCEFVAKLQKYFEANK